jgi:hypothetical protein
MTGMHGGHQARTRLESRAELLWRNTFAVLGTVLIVGVGLTEALVNAIRHRWAHDANPRRRSR